MKILSIALFNNPKGQGGIETFNRNMDNLYKNDLKIITWSFNYLNLYKIDNLIEIGNNCIIFRLINKILMNKLRENLLKSKVKNLKPKNIIFLYPYEVKILQNIECKKILVQHTSSSEYMRVYCHDELKKKILQEKLDYFVVLSPNDKKEFERLLNIKSEKIRVIRHTCNLKILKEKKQKNKKLIIIARFDNYQKRIDLAIKAMKKLSEFELNIYGEGPDRELYINLIKEEELKNVFINDRTNQVQEKLDESSIFIMTSDYEGYPISLIEAMRRGLPIVLRNTFDSAQDIVVENQNGILLEKEWNEDKFVEAVKRIYNNYEYYSENSKKLGERYNIELIKKEWNILLGD